jgi:hypothetical protein
VSAPVMNVHAPGGVPNMLPVVSCSVDASDTVYVVFAASWTDGVSVARNCGAP